MAIPFIIGGAVAAAAAVAYLASDDDDDYDYEEERRIRREAEEKRKKAQRKEKKRQEKQKQKELKEYANKKLKSLLIKYNLETNKIDNLAERAIEDVDFLEEELLLIYDSSDQQKSAKKNIAELRDKIHLIDSLYDKI